MSKSLKRSFATNDEELSPNVLVVGTVVLDYT